MPYLNLPRRSSPRSSRARQGRARFRVPCGEPSLACSPKVLPTRLSSIPLRQLLCRQQRRGQQQPRRFRPAVGRPGSTKQLLEPIRRPSAQQVDRWLPVHEAGSGGGLRRTGGWRREDKEEEMLLYAAALIEEAAPTELDEPKNDPSSSSLHGGRRLGARRRPTSITPPLVILWPRSFRVACRPFLFRPRNEPDGVSKERGSRSSSLLFECVCGIGRQMTYDAQHHAHQ